VFLPTHTTRRVMATKKEVEPKAEVTAEKKR
jgi:hypothetical protein